MNATVCSVHICAFIFAHTSLNSKPGKGKGEEVNFQIFTMSPANFQKSVPM